MEQLCLSLLAFAAQLGGYDTPTACPVVERAPKEVLRKYVCPNQACPVTGVYVYGDKRLLIADNLKLQNLYTRSVIVHELVHYLQDLNGEAEDKECNAHLLRERVAFFVQEKFLRANYLRADLRPSLNLYKCAG